MKNIFEKLHSAGITFVVLSCNLMTRGTTWYGRGYWIIIKDHERIKRLNREIREANKTKKKGQKKMMIKMESSDYPSIWEREMTEKEVKEFKKLGMIQVIGNKEGRVWELPGKSLRQLEAL